MTKNPKLSRYVVQRGDCLWNIAKAQYGDPLLWHEISKSNRLKKPGHIVAGQILQLPRIPMTDKGIPRAAPPSPPAVAKTVARPVAIPGFKYDFSKLPVIPLDAGTYIVTLRLKGSVSAQKKGVLDGELTRSGIELKYQREADTAMAKLMSDATIKIGYSKPPSMEINFSSASRVGGDGFKHSIGVSDPITGEITFTCEGREMVLDVGPFRVKGVVGFEAKLKPKSRKSTAVPAPALLRGVRLGGAALGAAAIQGAVSLWGSATANSLTLDAALMLI